MASALDIQRSASLLPYLQGARSDARLKLSLFQSDPSLRDKAYPFEVLDDTPAVSRLIKAAFLTDAGSVLKKVVLQVQKDRYALAADELRPLTNLDIDAFWQQAFPGGPARAAGTVPILISSQRDARGTLTPLAPLFLCRERGLFFHPVCPGCGLPLTLCRDDGLLQRFELTPYTTSLKRYLHCDGCCREGLAEFYLYELDHDDLVTVKDRWALIDRFSQVEASLDPDGEFPCVGCPERAGCFGPIPRARTRIVPFSFYPFYLLLNDAPSLHAIGPELCRGSLPEPCRGALRTILAGLVEEARSEVRRAAAPKPPSDDDDETMETVVLRPRPPNAPAPPEAALDETYLQPRTARAPWYPQGLPEAAEDMLETMLAAPSRSGQHRLASPESEAPGPVASGPAPGGIAAGADHLAETVFIQPSGRRPRD